MASREKKQNYKKKSNFVSCLNTYCLNKLLTIEFFLKTNHANRLHEKKL